MSSQDSNDALERAWREASTDRPPPNVDAAVIAAARASVAEAREATSYVGQVRPRPMPWLARWQPLLAAAAVAGLALVLVPMLPREHGSAPTMQRQQSTAAPGVESVPERAPVPEEGTAVTRRASPPSADTALTERRERAVPAPPASPARSDSPPGLTPGVVPPAPASSDVPAQASDRETPAPAAGSAPASPTRAAEAPSAERAAAADAVATFGQAAAPSPEAARWAARIEALHAAGELDAAARELRAFRAADPQADAHLPDSLRDWARTVEPFPPDPGRE